MRRIAPLAIACLLALPALASERAPAPAKKGAPAKQAAKAAQAKPAPETDRHGNPLLQSSGVMVLDATTGQTLFAKNENQVQSIASITKLMTAMVVLDAGLPLDESIEINSEDVDTLKNTHSRLPLGSFFRRGDLIRLSLVASDNRAASALGRNYPGGIAAFVEAMNARARMMGLAATHFVDSSGLAPGNVSSPADLAQLVSAAYGYPLIREYSVTKALDVTLPESGRKLAFVNTNALVREGSWDIGVSKTGFIRESGMCLVMQAVIANTPVVIVLLDSWGRLTRVGDANRIKRWLEKNPGKLALAGNSAPRP